MKNRISISAIITIIIFCTSLLFISCEGFLNAKETSSQISDSISYANAPFYTIFVDDSEGNGVIKAPAGGETQKKVSDSFTINYDPAPAYEFLYWKIIDKNNNNQEYANGEYFEIETLTNSETKCTFVRAPAAGMKLCLVPVLSERPQIISWNPKREPEGVNRDSRIEVMFDRPMALESIYYTKAEFDKLTEEKSISISNFLPEGGTVFEEHKYYGYKTAGDDTIVFKNIQIVSNDAQKENLLKYFEAPQFEDREHTSLAISVKKTNNIPNIPVNTNLQVTIDNNFYCYSGIYEKPVSLREKKTWPYWVNGKTDTTKPTVQNLEVKIVRNGNPTAALTANGTRLTMNNERLLKIKVNVTDYGSCPASSFDLVLSDGKRIPIYYERVQGAFASCGDNYVYALTKEDIPDGVNDYSFYLQFKDNSGNPAEGPYGPYNIRIDTVPIAKNDTSFPTKELSCPEPEPNLTPETVISETTSITFKYKCNASDYSGGKLYYRPAKPTTDPDWQDWSNVTDYVSLDSGSSEHTATIPNLPYGTTYELKADFYDTAENPTSYIFKKNTLPLPYSSSNTTVSFCDFPTSVKITPEDTSKISDETKLTYRWRYNKNANWPAWENDSSVNSITYIKENQRFNVQLSSGLKYNDITQYYSDNTDSFFLRRLPFNREYQVKIRSTNYERITEKGYDNYNKEYTNSIESFLSETIKSKAILNITSRETIYEETSCKRRYSFENSSAGIKYTYYKYNADGTPGTETSGTTTSDGVTSINNLELNAHYHFTFESYNIDEDNVCSPEYIKEDDFWTSDEFIYKPKTVTNLDIVTTATTALVTWTKPENSDFDHYKITYSWVGNNVNVVVNIPADRESYLITGLPPSRVTFYCDVECISVDGVSSGGKHASGITKKPSGLISLTRISISSNSKVSCSYAGEGYYNGKLKYGTSYNELNQESDYSGFNLPNDDPDDESDDIYYFQLYDENGMPSSQIRATARPYTIDYNKYYLQTFDYNKSTSSATWTWSWEPTQWLYLLYRKAGTNDKWTGRSIPSTTSTTTTISSLNLDYGCDYEIRFSDSFDSRNNTYGALYAAAFVSVPPNEQQSIITGITSSEIKHDSVKLSWDKFTDCNYYNIYCGNTLFADRLIPNNSNASEQSVVLTHLEPSTTYNFYIVPHRGNVEDSLYESNKITIKTAEPPDNMEIPPVSIFTVGSADHWIVKPGTTNEQIKDSDSWETVSLSWDITNFFQYSFKIAYRESSSNGEWNSICVDSHEFSTNGERYWIKGLKDATKYDFKIYTLQTIGDKTYESLPVMRSCYTNSKPAKFISSQQSDTSVTVTWEYPQGQYSKVELRISNVGNYLVKTIYYTDSEKPYSYTFNDLEPGGIPTWIYLYTYVDQYNNSYSQSSKKIVCE